MRTGAASNWRSFASRCLRARSSRSRSWKKTHSRISPVAMNLQSSDFATWMGGIQARVEAALGRMLPAPEIVPQRLHQAMRYAVLGGGKRVRPLLAFGAGDLAGADVGRVTIAGVAVELIHAYSLTHDDLPCMDDDVLRRGKPTCHVEYDEATALLVGDAL